MSNNGNKNEANFFIMNTIEVILCKDLNDIRKCSYTFNKNIGYKNNQNFVRKHM